MGAPEVHGGDRPIGVSEGQGRQDTVTLRPHMLLAPLNSHLPQVHAIHAQDLTVQTATRPYQGAAWPWHTRGERSKQNLSYHAFGALLHQAVCVRAHPRWCTGAYEESGMEYRRLGYSGLQVSVIGLGTNNFSPRLDYPAAERVLRQAIEAGINFIETSNTYGDGQAEVFIGQALRAAAILTPENFEVLDQLEAFAAARSRPLVELAFAWLPAHPQVSSVMAGATTRDQITANAKAVNRHLSAAEMEELDGVLQALAHTWDTPTTHLRPFRPW
jgi:Aldo/keto reductase family